MAWRPEEATDEIRRIARSLDLVLSYKRHAVERLAERDLIVSDVLYVLKHGTVYRPAVPATRPNYNRYLIEGRAPNSGARSIGVVVIPDRQGCLLKIITVMWMDELANRAGSIIGEEEDGESSLSGKRPR